MQKVNGDTEFTLQKVFKNFYVENLLLNITFDLFIKQLGQKNQTAKYKRLDKFTNTTVVNDFMEVFFWASNTFIH